MNDALSKKGSHMTPSNSMGIFWRENIVAVGVLYSIPSSRSVKKESTNAWSCWIFGIVNSDQNNNIHISRDKKSFTRGMQAGIWPVFYQGELRAVYQINSLDFCRLEIPSSIPGSISFSNLYYLTFPTSLGITGWISKLQFA